MSAVSVIVPTFNRAGLLGESLEALLRQSETPAEILIVDDGSSDGTPQIAAQYGDTVRLIEKNENKGKAHSINIAMTEIRHDLVWIMDDDDLAAPETLKTLTSLLADNPKAGFAYGRHDRFCVTQTGAHTSLGAGYWRTCPPDEFLIATLEDFFVHQPGMIVRRETFHLAGKLDESLARSQDYDHLIRLARVAPCVSSEDIAFHQRQHDGARGTGANRFSADQRDAKWVSFDQQIFQKLHAEMTLDDFLPGVLKADTPETERRALLQRGVIMARKKLWALALEDLAAAAQVGGAPLSEEEQAILRRAFGSKYGCEEILSDSLLCTSIRGLRHQGVHGADIVRNLARGLRWRIREAGKAHDFSASFGYARRYVGLNF